MQPIYVVVVVCVIVVGLVLIVWMLRHRVTSFKASGSVKRGDIGVEGKTEIGAAPPDAGGLGGRSRSPKTKVQGTRMAGRRNRLEVRDMSDVRNTQMTGDQHRMRVAGESEVRNTRMEGEEQEFIVGESESPVLPPQSATPPQLPTTPTQPPTQPPPLSPPTPPQQP